MNTTDYWEECIAQAAEGCGLVIAPDQLKTLADSAKSGHENYGMAFYSPPDSERMDDIEKEWKAKLKAKDQELECYQRNAETAIKQALHQNSDSQVSIGAYGEVLRHGGRTERIQ